MPRQTFGRLTILRVFKVDGRLRCKAECVCGSKPKTYLLGHLQRGHTQSCGCLQRERAVIAGRARRKTGHAINLSGEYRAWQNMRKRCYYQKQPSYKTYGAAGVRVCQHWLGPQGFQNFLADVGLKPTAKHSLSRKLDTGNYNNRPGQVSWQTSKEQGQQRRLRNKLRAA